MNKPRDIERRMLDIFLDHNQAVEVQISPGPLGRTLWVNVDGVCRLRIGGITNGNQLSIDGLDYVKAHPTVTTHGDNDHCPMVLAGKWTRCRGHLERVK